MVYEFPELQGIIGRKYAERNGEPAEVALAIAEHYQPRGAEDALPTGAIGALLGLADRLDSIVGFFGIGKAPTGTADPFGLRRAAVGIIHVLRARGWHLSLDAAIEAAIHGFAPTREGKKNPIKVEAPALVAETREFFRTRMKGALTAENVPS